MLVTTVPIRHDRLEPSTITGANLDLDPLAHAGIVAHTDAQRDSYDRVNALAELGRQRLAIGVLGTPGQGVQASMEGMDQVDVVRMCPEL
jgi:hypothetical protein